MNNDTKSSSDRVSSDDQIIQTDNVLVINKSAPDQTPDFLTISYPSMASDGSFSAQTLRLIISPYTVIINAFGFQVYFTDIQAGTYIDAQFSSDIAAASPPQTVAYLIVSKQLPATDDTLTTTDWVATVDTANGLIYTGNSNSINSQKRFIIANATQITDQYGTPIPLSAVLPGHIVRISHAPFQTGCIPPQAMAYTVQQF